jgi:hypothetical protein
LKNTFHVDEGFSAAITGGDWQAGVDPAPHGVWIDGGELFDRCFCERLADGASVDFARIAEATALDVHPPLYYWALAIARAIFGARNLALAGYALNLALFALSCALLTFVAVRVWGDRTAALLTLALFAFSSASISLSLFIRMYELLQTVCLAFLASASLVLFPSGKRGSPERASPSGRARSLAVAGICLSSFLGLMTHYYFLIFLAPVAVFSLAYLAMRKDPVSLLWAALATLVGLYLAYRAFPAMEEHLFGSYRSTQGLDQIVGASAAVRLGYLAAYLKILSTNLVPLIAPVAVLAIAISARLRGAEARRLVNVNVSGESSGTGTAGNANGVLPPFARAAFILFLCIFAVTFTAIAISSPYRSARYVAAFFPEYALAFVGVTRLLLPAHPARVMIGAAAILVAAHGLNPANVCAFHEDYAVEPDPYYLRDGKPVIILAAAEGGGWKNMLPYVNVRRGTRVFVATAPIMADPSAYLSAIAKGSGSGEAYAIVDHFAASPAFKRIGHYGFFEVYLVPSR